MDAIEALGEEIDGRRAVQREIRGTQGPLQDGHGLTEEQDQINLAVIQTTQHRPQTLDGDEQETLRKGEILVDVAITLERRRAVGQQ